MPARKKTTYRRRPKRRYRKRPAGVNRYQGPLMRQLKTNLTYSDTYSMTSSFVTTSSQVWSLNGLHDPDITGIGHQPRGFDELIALYDHYVVIGCEVELLLANTQVNQAALCVATIRDNNIAVTSLSDQLEATNRQTIQLAPEGTGGSTRRMHFRINPNKFLGRSKPLADPDLKGNAASNPQEGCFLHLGCIASAGDVAVTVQCTATIKYLVMMIEPKNPSQS